MGTLVVTVTVVGIEIATKEVVAEVEAADTKVTTLTTTGRLGTTVVVDAADVVGTTVVMAGGGIMVEVGVATTVEVVMAVEATTGGGRRGVAEHD